MLIFLVLLLALGVSLCFCLLAWVWVDGKYLEDGWDFLGLMTDDMEKGMKDGYGTEIDEI